MLMDLLIAYAPSPVKPLLYLARRHPVTLSLGLMALGVFAVTHIGTFTKVANTALAAKYTHHELAPHDVAVVGWAVTALGAVYPGFACYGLANQSYVLLAHGDTCRAIRSALEAIVQKEGGLIYVAVPFRGVVIDAFETRYAVDQIQKEKLQVSVGRLRSEYRRLARSIDGVVSLCTEAVRDTRQGHMHRLVLDVRHGGVLYEQVIGRTYLMGCVIDQDCMESANGELPRAYGEMIRLIDALKALLHDRGGRNVE
jgi:hypothetical protein